MLVQARFVRVPGLLSGDLFSLLWLLCLSCVMTVRSVAVSVVMSVPW